MDLCVAVGCSRKNGKDKGSGFFRTPKVTTNQGEEREEISTRRRNEWISVVSCGDATSKRVLEKEKVCSKHLVFGEPAPDLGQYHVNWISAVALERKRICRKI